MKTTNKPLTQVDAIYEALRKAGSKGLTSEQLSTYGVRYACAISAIRHEMRKPIVIVGIKGTHIRRYFLGQFYKDSLPENPYQTDVLKVLKAVSPNFIKAKEIGYRIGKTLPYVYKGLKSIKNLEKVSLVTAGKVGRPSVAYRVKS